MSAPVSVIPVDEVCLDHEDKIPYLALHCAAADEDVEFVLSASTEGNDGRSEWRWFRLPNGDLILGVFPQGDTYLAASANLEL